MLVLLRLNKIISLTNDTQIQKQKEKELLKCVTLQHFFMNINVF